MHLVEEDSIALFAVHDGFPCFDARGGRNGNFHVAARAYLVSQRNDGLPLGQKEISVGDQKVLVETVSMSRAC